MADAISPERRIIAARRMIAALIVLLGLSALALVTIGDRTLTRHFMQEASLQAGSALRLAVAALSGHLSRYEPLPTLIADHQDMKDLLMDPDNAGLRQLANQYLKEINTLLESSDIYVMTTDGTTIAASNFDGPASFVGENFSYRPYFQEAAAGRPARFYALGTTSAKRGYYFSAPVRVSGEIRGVIVFKVDIEGIESSWQGGEYKILVSDPEGIIFMTGNPEWLYASVLPLTQERLSRTEESRRYSDAILRELPVARSSFAGHDLMTISQTGSQTGGQSGGSREYLMLEHYMPGADWTVKVLLDTASIHAQARTSLVAILLFLCLSVLGGSVVIQRRARLQERMFMQIEAQAELERRVEERTADLARVNLQLRQTQADLIQAGKLAGLGQMSAALSHEFNQPLAAAKTYADSAALLIERNRIAEAQDNLGRISKLIDRMASISRHLRNFARKPNERLGAVRIEDAVRDTLEIVSARLASAGATVNASIPAGLPPVRGGPVRLQQVLVNILTNACDAVEELEDREIMLRAREEGNHIIIEIGDRGPGVPPAIIERIFDPFFTTKGVGKGLGLGLSISYNIIKDFGGSLAVLPRPGGGALFRIGLMQAQVEAGAGTLQEVAV
ncbi:sensor histidine kinase [Pannonibacter phragmitetus]|uniref:C4-dicarboxylate transport sensor protein DctB n=1 Tax=Pannonibacter phragmitetus TaxID=121719 RepID=A0A0U3Q2T7_9HYPH|nr:ATP-binding protein [Pannonibacter phragmitetus]ALV26905.1 histidine kinase [Pannonibacter phragmitetus]